MSKDEKAWAAMEVPKAELERDGFLSYAEKHLTEKIAKRLLDALSGGKEYAVKMMSVQEIDHVESGTAEIRRAMSMREIVRCKDCVNAQHREIGMVYCPLMVGSWVADDWFCADGKRREGILE